MTSFVRWNPVHLVACGKIYCDIEATGGNLTVASDKNQPLAPDRVLHARNDGRIGQATAASRRILFVRPHSCSAGCAGLNNLTWTANKNGVAHTSTPLPTPGDRWGTKICTPRWQQRVGILTTRTRQGKCIVRINSCNKDITFFHAKQYGVSAGVARIAIPMSSGNASLRRR